MIPSCCKGEGVDVTPIAATKLFIKANRARPPDSDSNLGFTNGLEIAVEQQQQQHLGLSRRHLLRLRGGRLLCRAKRGVEASEPEDATLKRGLQAALWAAEAAYILWLFLLPYAPGDPVWAIKPSTVSDLLGLSLNFFFVLPLLNSVGIHVIEAPVLHPMAEGLFNFVIGWTFLFAPLLFTDCRRERFKGSLDLLWGFQMFLTNTFLIPYMAIRLNDTDVECSPSKTSQLGSLMVRGASIVGIIGGLVCCVSTLWALYGRGDGDFGGLADRWQFLGSYIGSDRLAYAFLWDMFLYSIFQPWLIGGNLQNVKKQDSEIVNVVRFIPVVGLVTYLLSLDDVKEF
ncbi:uncharacterized protein [Typha latifolia]|uniref:uncharacterized protein n=1 Tax=Typha latifolia TaxID=4733 RepID=UPI003C2E7CF9